MKPSAIDDEAAARALVRHVVVARRVGRLVETADAARLVAAARRGVDVDDRRVDPLGDVGEVDRAGDGRPRAGRAPSGRGASAWRARHDRRLADAPRDDDADEERDG